MPINNDDTPLFNIGVVAQLIGVHPETLRIWERHQLIDPTRRNKQRLYTNNDLKRLNFIHTLINKKGLNISGVKQVLSMYNCWHNKQCTGGLKSTSPNDNVNSKLCWKEENTYCDIKDKSDKCLKCPYYPEECPCPK